MLTTQALLRQVADLDTSVSSLTARITAAEDAAAKTARQVAELNENMASLYEEMKAFGRMLNAGDSTLPTLPGA